MASASLSLSAVPSGPALPSRRGSPAPPPSAARCRPLRVSASCATSTAERPRPRPRAVAAGARSQSPSLYEVLGIRAGATGQEIKSAYRRLARVLHPDVAATSAGAAGAAAAGREFMRVHEAYATLSDPDRRADYDRTLFQGPGRFAVSAVAAAAAARGPSRRWETDQCW
ncbi:chaperone protein dnaJ 11, chloroplastic-like [Syzygium oleosum]|uniref:chaperone protein dnaJ 11, chloroplastic-like n=1 Tax=Syzygium oleosum TaxID=219896 RepID=UPI0024BB40C1|nr:chaperone protein dnaJ 11, chloroplastic-like [Syzygium oleosum]